MNQDNPYDLPNGLDGIMAKAVGPGAKAAMLYCQAAVPDGRFCGDGAESPVG